MFFTASAVVQCCSVGDLPQLNSDGAIGGLLRGLANACRPLDARGRLDGQVEDGESTAHSSHMCSWLASSLLRPARLAGGGKADAEEAVREIFTPPVSTSRCDVGRVNQSLEGGSRSRAAGGRDPRATWRHGQDLRATGRHDLWLRVQGYMFNQTLGNRFNQSLEGGHAPQQLADMTVGYLFN